MHRYAKDKKGKRIGCFVAVIHEATGELCVGWSKLHKLDYSKKFDQDKTKMIAEGRALKKSKTIVPNKLVKQMMIFSLDAAYSLKKEVSYPDFSNSKTYQKIKKEWDERRVKWQEKAILKDQETSATNSGAETTTQSSE